VNGDFNWFLLDDDFIKNSCIDYDKKIMIRKKIEDKKEFVICEWCYSFYFSVTQKHYVFGIYNRKMERI
jgi:hypothetical protein